MKRTEFPNMLAEFPNMLAFSDSIIWGVFQGADWTPEVRVRMLHFLTLSEALFGKSGFFPELRRRIAAGKKEYDVHVYFEVRVKLKGVKAFSQRDAINKAERKFDAYNYLCNMAEDERITGFLVDEAGDPEHQRTRFYNAYGEEDEL